MSDNFIEKFDDLVIEQYYENKNTIRDFFERTSMNEYVALKEISKHHNDEKIYLKDLAKTMQISYQALAQIIRNLKDKGYVNWTYDGDGKEGTYIEISEDGLNLLSSQKEFLKQYYSKILKVFGKDKLFQLLSLLHELQMVMHESRGDE
ncbi:MAG: MarR family winged helix-turn-helix transcriptional regulator [Floccifex porci]|uniref:MarR family winged helix-turn-helix transcriptional regulator n=1 Tax=Floccifex porci TaxID=2606629 RepID=UPI003F0D5DF0